MNELVKVIINKSGNQTVNGRELHEFLKVETDYNHWIERKIKKYGFIKNTDFIVIIQKKSTNNPKNPVTTQQNHILEIDMAKELSMAQNTESGREARKYFIECTKEYKLKEQNQKPRVLFFERERTDEEWIEEGYERKLLTVNEVIQKSSLIELKQNKSKKY